MRVPYRQGSLDSLCSIYALINLCHYQKPLSTEQAYAKFKDALVAVRDCEGKGDGTLLNYVTEGIDNGEHFMWLANKIKVPLRTFAIQGAAALSVFPAVIFLEECSPENGNSFSHYTVAIGHERDTIKLFDSYGFDRLILTDEPDYVGYLDGKRMKIISVYLPLQDLPR